MIKKSLMVGAGVLLLAGLLMGTSAVSYMSTAWNRVHTSAKDSIPIDFELDRARQMIRDLNPEIKRNMHRIAREEVEVAKLQRNLDRQEEQLADARSDIMRLKSDLESGDSYFVYAGRTYSEDQVKSDLANRFQHFKTAEATVQKLRKILDARQQGLQAAREKLEATLADKRQLEVQVENLEARLKMIEVAQTTSEFNIDDSQLARTRELIDEIETRLDVSEKLLNEQVKLYDRIPLDEADSQSDNENIVEKVTEYFGQRPEIETLANTGNADVQ
jgi:phage shock protein A